MCHDVGGYFRTIFSLLHLDCVCCLRPDYTIVEAEASTVTGKVSYSSAHQVRLLLCLASAQCTSARVLAFLSAGTQTTRFRPDCHLLDMQLMPKECVGCRLPRSSCRILIRCLHAGELCSETRNEKSKRDRKCSLRTRAESSR